MKKMSILLSVLGLWVLTVNPVYCVQQYAVNGLPGDTTSYDEGYKLGYEDGIHGKNNKCEASIYAATAYLNNKTRGYLNGYNAGALAYSTSSVSGSNSVVVLPTPVTSTPSVGGNYSGVAGGTSNDNTGGGSTTTTQSSSDFTTNLTTMNNSSASDEDTTNSTPAYTYQSGYEAGKNDANKSAGYQNSAYTTEYKQGYHEGYFDELDKIYTGPVHSLEITIDFTDESRNGREVNYYKTKTYSVKGDTLVLTVDDINGVYEGLRVPNSNTFSHLLSLSEYDMTNFNGGSLECTSSFAYRSVPNGVYDLNVSFSKDSIVISNIHGNSSMIFRAKDFKILQELYRSAYYGEGASIAD